MVVVGARKAATPQPGFEVDTVQLANDEISFKPGGAGGKAVGRGSGWLGSESRYTSVLTFRLD